MVPFLKRHISLRQHWFIGHDSIQWQESEVSRSVATDVYQWMREICGWRLINHDDLRLGGAGPAGPIHYKVVDIDKSCFSHKPKVGSLK